MAKKIFLGEKCYTFIIGSSAKSDNELEILFVVNLLLLSTFKLKNQDIA